MDLDHTGWAQYSPLRGLDLGSFLQDICIGVFLLEEYTWNQVHRDLDHKDFLVVEDLVDSLEYLELVEELYHQDKY